MWCLVYLPITSTFVTGLKASHTVTAFAYGCHQDLDYQAEVSIIIPTEEMQPYFRINFSLTENNYNMPHWGTVATSVKICTSA